MIDATLTLGGVTIGPAPFVLETAPAGFGLAGIRAVDAQRGDRHGDVAGDDVYEPRSIVADVAVLGDDQAATGVLLRDLQAAWAASSIEKALDVDLPVFAEPLRFYGRPRGCVVDLSPLAGAAARAQVAFRALDPLGYGAPVTSAALAPGAHTVTNGGDATTDRATIVLVGSGGTPQLTNATDDAGAIAWAVPLAAGAVRTIDLRAATVVDGAADRYSEVTPGSRWFRLRPGPNAITVAGVTSATFTHRPAWP